MYFIDYEIDNDGLNGLEVLDKLNLKVGYLITSHAEEAWLQKEINKRSYKIFMFPKSMINGIKLEKY